MKNHAVIMLKEEIGKVLFAQRATTKKFLPDAWSFPSGTMETGESVEETVKREAMEELGVEVMVESKMGEVELSEFGARLHFMICKIVKGEPSIKEPTEIQKLEWYTFPEFFAKFNDHQIGHGLIYLRQHPALWQKCF